MGLEVDLCRSVAIAMLGADARIEFRGLYAPSSFEAVRRGQDDLVFLTVQEMAEQQLTSDVVPLTPVFFEPEQILVPGASQVAGASGLEGKRVCFEPGTRADRDLEALVASRGIRVFYGPFFEEEEMVDAFNVGRCDAIVGEATFLAALRSAPTKARSSARLLPDVLSAQPIFAAVRSNAEGRWAQIVTWALQTSIVGDRFPKPGLGKPGADGDPLPPPILAPELGLDRGWQARMIALAGSYADMHRRSLGDLSPLDLPRGVNEPPGRGGLLGAPLAE